MTDKPLSDAMLMLVSVARELADTDNRHSIAILELIKAVQALTEDKKDEAGEHLTAALRTLAKETDNESQ